MFLEMWQISTGQQEDFQTYYPWSEQPCTISGEGFVQPYADSPLDTENVGKHIYLQILNQARDADHYATPMGQVGHPHDHLLLLSEPGPRGGRVYEYEKGFMHAKTFVCDDRVATVNLDFRSLYLHFECGALLFDSPAIRDIKQ